MQITLMIPNHSSGSLSTPKNNSPVSRQNSPKPRVINASNSPRHPAIENKIALLRELSGCTISPKYSPRVISSVHDGYVKSQVTEIERRTPPKKTEVEAYPQPIENIPRHGFIGIAKLNSSEKKGTLLPPRPPRKDSVPLPQDSPKNEPLPPLPREINNAEGEFLSQKKPVLTRTNSDAGLQKQPLDRGDFTSIRGLGIRINHLTSPRHNIANGVKNVFADYIDGLSHRLLEKDDGIFMRVHVQSKVLVTNTENKFVWVNADNENQSGNIQRNSKATLISILKTLKRAAKTSLTSEQESDITKNVDRLLENETIKKYYDHSSEIRKRIHAIYFKVIYSKLYADAKLIKHVLKLLEYNILQMCEFLIDEQEILINKYKNIYQNNPTKLNAIHSIIERLNHGELAEAMNTEEKAKHIERLWMNPRELAVATPQGYSYNVRQIIQNTYKACRDFRSNTIFIDNLKDYIDAMSEEKREGSLLSSHSPKTQAKQLLENHFIGACITTIMNPHSRFLTVHIAILPHVIRDIYKRTVLLLEENGKIHKIDTVKYLDVIRFQTKTINDQTIQWKLLTGTLSEIAQYVPQKKIALIERSSKQIKKR